MRPATVEKAVCVHEEQNGKNLDIRVAMVFTMMAKMTKITTKMVIKLMMTRRLHLFVREAVQPRRVVSREATDVLLLSLIF